MSDERFHCKCGEPQGTLQGNWWVYPNPSVCAKCGVNNDEKLKHFIIDSVIAAGQPRKRKVRR